MTSRVWKVVLSVTTALGIFIGYRVSEIEGLQPYKLLNILGLLYSLLAVFVLSEVLITSPNWKRICVEKIAPVLLWAHTIVPVGSAIGAGVAAGVGRGPSASVTAAFAIGAFGYMGIVGLALEQTVVLPRLFKRDVESRWRYFGLVLLASGLLFQLISAVEGL